MRQEAEQGAKVRDLSVWSHWVVAGPWSQHRPCWDGGGFWGVQAPRRAGLTYSDRQQLSSHGHAASARLHSGPSCGETERALMAARAPRRCDRGYPRAGTVGLRPGARSSLHLVL